MGKRLPALVMLLLVAAVAFAVQVRHSPTVVYLEVTDAGDTAEVLKVNEFTANDSFDFEMDLEGGLFGGADSLIKWTSPLQVARIMVTSPLDTTAIYRCSVDMGTSVYGFAYDIVGIDTTMQSFIDSLVDSINAVVGMTDSVVAHDSTALGMIKVISKFGQQNLEGGAKWSLRLTGTEIALGDSVQTTIAMVCDSMAAKVNSTDSVSTHVTGANDGDTVWTVTSNVKGIAFTLDVADSSSDTAYVTPNKASWSVKHDTIDLTQLYHKGRHARGLILRATIVASDTSRHGLGLLDSGYLWLRTRFDSTYFPLDSVKANALPEVLWVVIPYDSPGVDTLLKEVLSLEYRIADSTSDTSGWRIPYNIEIDYNIID